MKTRQQKGFTLIELLVVIAIIFTLSTIVIYSTTQYISKGKDSNIQGSLAVLVPAGETYYNANTPNSYTNFCDPTQNGASVIKSAISQMPVNVDGLCYSANLTPTSNAAGVCCYVAPDGNSWVACAAEFSDDTKAYCVDSRGVKEEIPDNECVTLVSKTFHCDP